MDDGVLLLARAQFALGIGAHIVFPALTVGLASYIALLELWQLWRPDARVQAASRFWLQVLALTFGLGVVTGLAMPFLIGTSWSAYARRTAEVIGPLMAYEGFTAFALEAGFLGVLLFGRQRVSPALYALSAVAVAAGTLFSSFWILAVNSWMQTPAGHVLLDGRFLPQDFAQVIFSPSFPYRLVHTVAGFYVTTGFVVLGVSCWQLGQRRRAGQAAAVPLLTAQMALAFLALAVPLQIVAGDRHGLNTLQHQPAKIAAIEGLWETRRGAPLLLFAWPDAQAQANRAEVAIPRLASWILRHDGDAEITGLRAWPREQQPPVAPVFFAFRLMVGIGVAMLAVTAWGAWLAWRGRLAQARGFQRVAVAMLPSGFVAVLAGWTVTELGRQPWTVYGLLRTADSVTPQLHAGTVLGAGAVYGTVYAVALAATLRHLWRLVQRGPEAAPPTTPTGAAAEGTAQAAQDAGEPGGPTASATPTTRTTVAAPARGPRAAPGHAG